jgi:non-heme Fe2+,alpha-ketoglutarate-dependent halogenase
MPGTHHEMHYDETKRMQYRPETIGQKDKEGMTRGFFGYDYRELQKDPNWKPDDSKAIDLVMRPGQCIIFWSTLLHSSFPHTDKAAGMRLGFVARYTPTSVKLYPETTDVEEYGGSVSLENYAAVLVSGKDETGINPIATETRRGEPFGRR